MTNSMTTSDQAGLSDNQRCMLALALACDMTIAKPSQRAALRERHRTIRTQSEAAAYIREVENRIHSRRAPH
jgi:hypothetical protein